MTLLTNEALKTVNGGTDGEALHDAAAVVGGLAFGAVLLVSLPVIVGVTFYDIIKNHI